MARPTRSRPSRRRAAGGDLHLQPLPVRQGRRASSDRAAARLPRARRTACRDQPQRRRRPIPTTRSRAWSSAPRASTSTFRTLRDESQQVARAYDAACTPDIFVFDPSARADYNGRLDDNWQHADKVQRQDLRLALDAASRAARSTSRPCTRWAARSSGSATEGGPARAGGGVAGLDLTLGTDEVCARSAAERGPAWGGARAESLRRGGAAGPACRPRDGSRGWPLRPPVA